MLLLRAERIKMVYGDRVVLDIEEFSVYTGDRIGVVGANGAGKTTLFQLLAGELDPEEGRTERYGTVAYCRQFEEDSIKVLEKQLIQYEGTVLFVSHDRAFVFRNLRGMGTGTKTAPGMGNVKRHCKWRNGGQRKMCT